MPTRNRKKQKKYRRTHYLKNKEQIVLKNRQREDSLRSIVEQIKDESSCCEEVDNRCLDFHHEEKKEMEIAQIHKSGWGIDRIIREIEKCRILCANCHRKVMA